MKEKITEDNCKQALFYYTTEHFTKADVKQAMNQFPYATEDVPEELAWKDIIDWFILEYVQPKTGKTIAEEFAEKVPLDTDLKRKMLQMRHMHHSTFRIVENQKDILQVFDVKSGKNYTIQLFSLDPDKYRKGRIIDGRIHPWGDAYRFAGIFHISMEPKDYGLITEPMIEQMMQRIFDKKIERLESIIVGPHTKTSALLNKYPSHWIDGMAKALGINVKMLKDDKIRAIVSIVTTDPRKIIEKLPQKCQEALDKILEEGGLIRYGTLAKKYDDEIDFWWNEQPPKSTLGLLRLHGLLYVGKLPMNSRLIKVAVVPKDLRENLTKSQEFT